VHALNGWSTARTLQGMADGQVSFHDKKRVRKTVVEKRINEITNRLNKTKTESHPDIETEQKVWPSDPFRCFSIHPTTTPNLFRVHSSFH
jgi:hypothetical protein